MWHFWISALIIYTRASMTEMFNMVIRKQLSQKPPNFGDWHFRDCAWNFFPCSTSWMHINECAPSALTSINSHHSGMCKSELQIYPPIVRQLTTRVLLKYVLNTLLWSGDHYDREITKDILCQDVWEEKSLLGHLLFVKVSRVLKEIYSWFHNNALQGILSVCDFVFFWVSFLKIVPKREIM